MQPPDEPLDDGEGSLWKGLIERGQVRLAAGRAQAERAYEKYHDRPLIDVAVRIYYRDREAAGTIVSSAVAFRLFLFFVPLLLFVVGIFGFFAEVVSEDDVSDAGISGGLARQINSALSQPSSTRWIAVLVGLFGMITTGRTLSKTLVSASCLAWRLPLRARASVKAIGAIVGLVAGTALISILVGRVREELGLAVASISFVAALAVYVLGWLLVSMVLPRSPSTDASALVPGAVLVGVTVAGLQAVSQLYLPSRFDRASELYGAVGTTIVVLGWFFIIGRMIVLSMNINAVIYERFGSISQFVFSLPVLRRLPRRFPKLRKPFGLEEDAPDLQA